MEIEEGYGNERNWRLRKLQSIILRNVKKIKLLSNTPIKDIRRSEVLMFISVIFILIFGFSVNHLTKNQALTCLYILMALVSVGIFLKVRGTIKEYRFMKKEIENGHEVNIG